LVFGAERDAGPCPALRFDADEHSHCDLCVRPEHYHDGNTDTLRRAALHLTRSGESCDARFNGEWRNDAFHRMQDAADQRNAGKTAQAWLIWR
jgi:hypothetical protein